MATVDETTRRPAGGRDEHFSISLSFDDALFVIELFGELDLAGTEELERVIARAKKTSAVTIIVDLSGLHFLDSSGIRVLLAACNGSGPEVDRLRFLRGTGQVERTLELCGVDGRIPYLD
jgi:anti-sigma B factor antagonist